MAGSPVEQVRENIERSIKELELVEELEEHAYSDIRETDDVIAYLVENGGLDRDAVEDLIEEEEEELKLESKAVQLEEDALMRFKESLKILGNLTEMILEEERSTESKMDYLSQKFEERDAAYGEEFQEDALNVFKMIRDEMEGEFEQLETLVSVEKKVVSALSYVLDETEMAEHLEKFQGVEEKRTAELGKKNNREQLVNVARGLYRSNQENEERSYKEAMQEATEASKAREETEIAENELENLCNDADKVVEFITGLNKVVEDSDFKNKLASEMDMFKRIRKKADELRESSRENIVAAEEINEEAKKAADI